METKDFLDILNPMVEKLKKEASESAAKQEEAVKEIQEKIKTSGGEIGEMKAAVDTLNTAIDEIKAKQGRLVVTAQENKGFSAQLKDAIVEHKDAFENYAKTGKFEKMELKVVGDMTTSVNHTGNVAINQANNVPPRGMNRHMMGSILDVIPNGDALQYDYMREVVPTGEGSFGPQTEGSAKEQIDYDTRMISLTLNYEAGYVTTTRQMLKNVRALSSIITRNLQEDFQRRIDTIALNAIAAAATAGSSAATVTAEAIIDYIVQVDDAGYNANGIVTTGAAWAKVLKTKPSDYSVPGGVVIGPDGTVYLAGIPLYKLQGVTASRIYVADWTKAYYVQGESFTIRSSDQHSDNFTKNKVTILGEAPIGVAIEAPSAFVFGPDKAT
jgi:HK97 family phage major capsid protein